MEYWQRPYHPARGLVRFIGYSRFIKKETLNLYMSKVLYHDCAPSINRRIFFFIYMIRPLTKYTRNRDLYRLGLWLLESCARNASAIKRALEAHNYFVSASVRVSVCVW